jgi:hypothetical protein
MKVFRMFLYCALILLVDDIAALTTFCLRLFEAA